MPKSLFSPNSTRQKNSWAGLPRLNVARLNSFRLLMNQAFPRPQAVLVLKVIFQ